LVLAAVAARWALGATLAAAVVTSRGAGLRIAPAVVASRGSGLRVAPAVVATRGACLRIAPVLAGSILTLHRRCARGGALIPGRTETLALRARFTRRWAVGLGPALASAIGRRSWRGPFGLARRSRVAVGAPASLDRSARRRRGRLRTPRLFDASPRRRGCLRTLRLLDTSARRRGCLRTLRLLDARVPRTTVDTLL
jgi:hypothetical protein